MSFNNKTSSSPATEEKAITPAPTAAVTEKGAYVAPRIVTHSAEKLQQASHPVNACASFIP